MQAIKEHKGLVVVVLLFIVISTLFNIINPIHEAPDEIRHYRYIRYIADLNQLPIQSGEAGNAQAHHPPLYYLTAALATFWVHPSDPLGEPDANPFWGYNQWEVGTDNKNLYIHSDDEAFPYTDEALASHLARFITTLYGVGAVIVTYFLSLEVFSNDKSIGLLASALLAFNPQFSYLSGAIINDVPAGLMGGILTLLSVIIVKSGMSDRRKAMAGIIYGLAVLTKVNLVAMIGVVGLAIFFTVTSDRNTCRKKKGGYFARAFLSVLLIGFLISGWFFVRNAILYGDLTGMTTLANIWGGHDPGQYVRSLGQELIYFWTSLWGRFGYGQIVMPPAFYWITAILSLIGAAGFALRILQENSPPVTKKIYIILGVTVLGNFLIVLIYLLTIFAGAMGRFFFPAYPAFAVILAGGWGWISEKVKLGQLMPTGLSALLFLLPLICLFGFIQPAYALPTSVKAVSENEPIAVFGSNIELLSYSQSDLEVFPGETIEYGFTWRALMPTEARYSFFIHIVNSDGMVIAQRDTYLGTGTYPSDFWNPGFAFADTIEVAIPANVLTPEKCSVYIGFYNPDLGNLPAGDQANILIGEIQIDSMPGDYPNSTEINFSDSISLVGFEINDRTISPGDEFHLVLYWRAEKGVSAQNLTSFVKLVRDWDQAAGKDSYPNTLPPETSLWTVGEVYRDERIFFIPEDIEPGDYEIWVGFYNDDMINIEAYRGDTNLGDHYDLVRLVVTES